MTWKVTMKVIESTFNIMGGTMVKPIKIRIRKKTLVRTKYQAKHKFRSDWKLVGVIDYNDSFKIFQKVNNTGVCETENQFAKLMYDNYGSGIYSCIAWIRGRGDGRFFGFWKAELSADGFMRLPKNVTSEMKDVKNNIRQLKKLKKQLTDVNTTGDERKDINDEITEIQDELGMNQEIVELESDNRSGPSGYLKCATPIYRMHEYEKLRNGSNTTEVEEVDFW